MVAYIVVLMTHGHTNITFILILSLDFKFMNNFNKKLYFKYVFPHSHNKHIKQFLHFINKFTVDLNRDIVNAVLYET